MQKKDKTDTVMNKHCAVFAGSHRPQRSKLTFGTVASIQAGQLAVDARSLQVAGLRAAADAFPVLQSKRTLLRWSHKENTTYSSKALNLLMQSLQIGLDLYCIQIKD